MSVLILFLCLLGLCSCMTSLDAATKKQAASQLVENLNANKAQQLVCYGTSLTENGAWVTAEEKRIPMGYAGFQ